jgi:photosystem II PsbU protein
MKSLIQVLTAFCLCLALLGVMGLPALAETPKAVEQLPETNFIKQDLQKIDLNNANIYNFRRIKGMYPTLGRIIIEHAPYASIEDVLNIPGLTEAQKQLIKDNADQFALYKPDSSMNRERINNANYRL